MLLVGNSPGDEVLVREMLARRRGLKVRSVETVDQACAMVAAFPPDCFLLNLSPPDADGTEAVRRLHGAAPRTPIIVLTSHGDELAGVAAVRAGAHHYLVKGQVGGNELSRIIGRAIVRARRSKIAAGATLAAEDTIARRSRLMDTTAVTASALATIVLLAMLIRTERAVTALELSATFALAVLAVALTLRSVRAGARVRRPTGTAMWEIRLPERTIESWNPAAARLFGYSASEVVGHEVRILVPERFREEADAGFAAVREGREVVLETRRFHRDGRELDLSMTLTPIVDQDGHVTGAVGIAHRIDGAARALSRAEEGFRGAFKFAPAGMCIVSIDPASYGRMLQVNPALCELTGRTEPVLLTTNLMEMMDPDGSDTDASTLKVLVDGERDTYTGEKRLTNGGGDPRWVRVDASIIRDDEGRPLYGLGQLHDITGRKVGQAAEGHLAAVVGSSLDAIIATDTERRITAWNRGAELLLGHASDDVVGRDLVIVIPAEIRDRERAFVDRAIAGETSRARKTLMRRLDGRVVEVSLATSPIYGPFGKTIGASAIARDITGETPGVAAGSREREAAPADSRDRERRDSDARRRLEHHFRQREDGRDPRHDSRCHVRDVGVRLRP